MSCHHVCRSCAATFEPQGNEALSLRARVAELEAERDRLRLQLDAIEGLVAGQPGADPTPSDDGWSTALAAAQAVVAERAKLLAMVRKYAEDDGHEYDGCEDIALADCRLCAVEKLIGRRL